MKQLVTNFTPLFDPVSKTLDFSLFPGFEVNKLYAVINVTQNKPIYIPGADGLGTSYVNNNIITLQYDTSTHNSNDQLSVFYETTTPFENNLAVENGGNLQQIAETLIQVLTELKVLTSLTVEGYSRIINIRTDELQQYREDINNAEIQIPTE